MGKYIVRRPRDARASDGKVFYKAANIQRLITEKRVRRKVVNKNAHVAYEKLLSKYLKEKKAAKKAAEPTPEPKAAPAKEPVKAKAAPVKAAPAKEEKKAGKKGKK